MLLERQKTLEEEFSHQSALVKRKLSCAKKASNGKDKKRYVTEEDEYPEYFDPHRPNIMAAAVKQNQWMSPRSRQPQETTLTKGSRASNRRPRATYAVNLNRASMAGSSQKYRNTMDYSLGSPAWQSIDQIWKGKDAGKVRQGRSYLGYA